MSLSEDSINFIRTNTDLTVEELSLSLNCSKRTVINYRKGYVGKGNGSGSHRRSEILRKRIRQKIHDYMMKNPGASCKDMASIFHHDTATIRDAYMSIRRKGL